MGCSKDEFTCSEGSCVTMDKRCDGKEDCQDYSDERACTSIQTFDGYNKFRVPHPIGNQTKLIVNLSIFIDKIININENNGYFKIKMRMVRTWYNPHLKFINLKRTAVKNLISSDDIKIMWIPWSVFHNEVYSLTPPGLWGIHPPGLWGIDPPLLGAWGEGE